MPRDGRRIVVRDESLLRWLQSRFFRQGEYYKFYPLNGTERDDRVVIRIKEDNQIEIVFEDKWRSLLDSMNLSTPPDSPEIRRRARNTDPWSD